MRIDSPDAISLMEDKYPALHECPCFQTRKRHQHESGNGNKIATAAVLVVPPSNKKTWVRSVIDTPLKPIPDEIIRDMLASKDSNHKRKKTPGVVAGRSQHQMLFLMVRITILII